MARSKKYNHLYTIASFGQFPVQIQCGVFGCGKTYSDCVGLGILCKLLNYDCNLTGLTFVVAGKTKTTVEGTVGSELKNIFGDDYIPTQSSLDGKRKDAILFGQNIIYIGNNNINSEANWRGISNIVGILCDEVTLITQDQYLYMLGRLRGEFKEIKEAISKLPDGHILKSLCLGFFVGTCNPDDPTHFIKKMIDSGKCAYTNWTMDDACWDGAEEMYSRLKAQYEPGSLHYRRYLMGEWTGAEGMVFSSFDKEKNILKSEDTEVVYRDFDRVVLGVDYGSNHPTAIVLVGVSGCQYVVLKNYKLQREAPSEIIYKIKQIYDMVSREGTKIKHLFIDPSAVALKDELHKNRMTYDNAKNEHSGGIGCINSKFYTGDLFIMDSCEELISEIYGYIYKDTQSGNDEVVKVHDDLCDSMRYAVYSDARIYDTGGIW